MQCLKRLASGTQDQLVHDSSLNLIVYLEFLAKIDIMPTYKVTYFNFTGLGEPIRFLLAQAGIPFEDNRIAFEEWPALKPKTPTGVLPILEVDGKPYTQSKAIIRLLARQNNLYGSDDYEAYLADVAADTIEDLRQPLTQYYWEKDPALKEKLKETAWQKYPAYLDQLNEQVKKNNGHFVNGKLTWADLLYTAYTEFLSAYVGHDFNKDHPELKKLTEKVKALPNIKAYLAKRPKTDF
nr:glutathione S-transferase-like isoform X1 [Nomia melanderi]